MERNSSSVPTLRSISSLGTARRFCLEKTDVVTKALTRGWWECKTALASVVVAAALLLRQLLWTATWLAAADGKAEACEGGVADSTIQGPV